MHTADPTALDRRHARLMLEAGIAAQTPTQDPPALQSWFPLPSAAMAYLPDLSPAAQLLYVHLWQCAARFTRSMPNRWFWRLDELVAPATGLSPRSLARARAELRTTMAFISTRAEPGRATWYALRWPLPVNPDADRAVQICQARELQSNGRPWCPRAAWIALADTARIAPETRVAAAEVARLLARPPRANDPGRQAAAYAALAATGPDGRWLARQLDDWAAPVGTHATRSLDL